VTKAKKLRLWDARVRLTNIMSCTERKILTWEMVGKGIIGVYF
jgi:hypothetical protein